MWIYEFQDLLPYTSNVNMIVSFDKVLDVNKEQNALAEFKEKVYIFADYLPPGKHNSCLLYNTTNAPKKGIYSFMTAVKPR